MNIVSILASAIGAMVVGFVWYGPLFGKQWMQLMGMKMDKNDPTRKDKAMKGYVGMFFMSGISAWVISIFMGYAGAINAVGGATIGFWAWLGFVATTMTPSVLFEGKPMKLYFINAGHYLVGMLVIGAILGTIGI